MDKEDFIFKVVDKILNIWFIWFIFLIIFWNIHPFLAWLWLFVYGYRKFKKRNDDEQD